MLRPLAEVASLALRLGFTAFGGPAAHISMLRDEVVVRRRWMSDEQFVDLLGATNLIPGPNSTEMVIHCGFLRAGWRGLIVGGACFILPAAAIVLALAWAYVRYGGMPAVEWMLYGIKPVIIAIIVQAIFGLSRTALKNTGLAVLGAIAFALYLAGVNELVVLFGAGAIVMLTRWRTQSVFFAMPVTLFLVFLKIGAVLYGSGYVLLAFLRNEFVERLGWLTEQQLLDAVAVGQFTPGPVFTTATFIGYVIGGWPGAALATIGIFLPSFVFVAISNPLIPRMRRSAPLAALLDGVNAGALGLMAGVTWQLGRAAITDVFTAVLAIFAAIVLLRWKINSAWLVIAGAMASFAVHIL